MSPICIIRMRASNDLWRLALACEYSGNAVCCCCWFAAAAVLSFTFCARATANIVLFPSAHLMLSRTSNSNAVTMATSTTETSCSSRQHLRTRNAPTKTRQILKMLHAHTHTHTGIYLYFSFILVYLCGFTTASISRLECQWIFDRSTIHLNSLRMCAIQKREKWKKDKDETQEEY